MKDECGLRSVNAMDERLARVMEPAAASARSPRPRNARDPLNRVDVGAGGWERSSRGDEMTAEAATLSMARDHSSPRFADQLFDELDSAGFMPPADDYAIARAAATAEGVELWESMKDVIGSDSWAAANGRLTLSVSDADCHRMLGLGYALAAYIVAPVKVSPAQLRDVLILGALTNFLVAVYDQFLDAGAGATDVLPRHAVASVFERSALPALASAAASDERVCGDDRTAVMVALTNEYRRRLFALPAQTNRAWLIRELGRISVAMYDAEQDSRNGMSTPQLHLKSALPFLVMGMPAWLVASRFDRQLFRWHRRWLYRLGRFIGWVDDAVDVDDDRMSGQPNLVQGSLAGAANPDTSMRLAAQIATQGRDIRDQWLAHTAGRLRAQPHRVDGLSLTVCSWFGGVRAT
jgi:hypothetical protein